MTYVKKLTEEGNSAVGVTFGDYEINKLWMCRFRFWARKLAVSTLASLSRLGYGLYLFPTLPSSFIIFCQSTLSSLCS
jgi:hypothetical protein